MSERMTVFEIIAMFFEQLFCDHFDRQGFRETTEDGHDVFCVQCGRCYKMLYCVQDMSEPKER